MAKREEKKEQSQKGPMRSPDQEDASVNKPWTPEEQAAARPMPLPTVPDAPEDSPGSTADQDDESSPAHGEGDTASGGHPGS